MFFKINIPKIIYLYVLFSVIFSEVSAGKQNKVILIRVHLVEDIQPVRLERRHTVPVERVTRTISDACIHGDTLFVRRYLSAGGNPNRRDLFSIDSLLKLAVENGHNEIVQALLNAGALVHHKNSGMKTYDYQLSRIPLLFTAAKRGNMHQCQMLLAAGADIDGKKGWSDQCKPLWGALSQGHAKVVDFLLRSGAQVNSALVELAQQRFEPCILQELREVCLYCQKSLLNVQQKTICFECFKCLLFVIQIESGHGLTCKDLVMIVIKYL